MKTIYMVVSGNDLYPSSIREIKVPDQLLEIMIEKAIKIATILSIDEPRTTYHIVWID